MIMMDAEADESTLSACALSTCHCQAVLANDVRVRRSASRNAYRGVSPCRCRSLIVHRNRALMVDGEKDEPRTPDFRTPNAKR